MKNNSEWSSVNTFFDEVQFICTLYLLIYNYKTIVRVFKEFQHSIWTLKFTTLINYYKIFIHIKFIAQEPNNFKLLTAKNKTKTDIIIWNYCTTNQIKNLQKQQKTPLKYDGIVSRWSKQDF